MTDSEKPIAEESVDSVDRETQGESIHEDEFYQQLPLDQSRPFIGKWNRLISQTNWEKGALISGWRESLVESGASAMQYSDEAWSRMVGDVTAQHVGRLRRTHDRFTESHSKYEGLYWSHFYAALDWDDAEMWLEGAVQNRWSVSRMRRQRWETLGKIPEQEPRIADVIVSEMDEGFQPLQFDQQVNKSDQLGLQGPRYDEPDFGDQPQEDTDDRSYLDVVADEPEKQEGPSERIFENLTELPEDLSEAAEAMKLAILRHKLNEWESISRKQVLDLLEALKKLTRSNESNNEV